MTITSAARADEVTGNFTIENGSPSASGGDMIFSLNADGTISASLSTTLADGILGFGFNSLAYNLPESNLSPTTPDNPDGWGDTYGTQPSGFLCLACGTTKSWTIGTTGEFTSVYQALNGGAQSTYDFFLLGQDGNNWAADAAPIPEPLTLSLFGAGFLGLGALRRRKTSKAV